MEAANRGAGGCVGALVAANADVSAAIHTDDYAMALASTIETGIDDKGDHVVTPITESIQVRVQRHVAPVSAEQLAMGTKESEETDQEVHPVALRRMGIFAGRGAREEDSRDAGFTQINPLPEDSFDATTPDVFKDQRTLFPS
jgi:hypothetical protein